ncbi:ribonuclease H-like domain-containing protein, partial [Candidatus Bathyarchaeota archaeon]|nr:ribonuclease H-like domain-containing protein [Candidatus Bathyarchaeota archaeon]
MEVKFFLLDADYIVEGEKTKIRLWGKTEDGKNAVFFQEADPYFYVLPNDLKGAKSDIEELLKKERLFFKKIEIAKMKLAGNEKEFLKIFAFKPANTQNLREKIKLLEEKRGGKGYVIDEFEYAINFYRKFLIDKKIDGCCWLKAKGEKIHTSYNVDFALNLKELSPLGEIFLPKLKTLAFDIETVEKKGEKEIIMASFFGKEFQKVITSQKANYPKWVELVKNEKELLEKIVKIFQEQNPDILFTYYGDSFDFRVLAQRCEKNKVKLLLSRDKKETKFAKRAKISAFRIPGIVHVDLFNFVQNILSP